MNVLVFNNFAMMEFFVLNDFIFPLILIVSGAPKSNHSAMIYAAKRNDYERVKILFKYGYRLEQKDNITDPLKKIELFKVIFYNLECYVTNVEKWTV